MKKKLKICFTLDGIYDYIFHITKFWYQNYVIIIIVESKQDFAIFFLYIKNITKYIF